ncbi:MAG: hypothetical protein HYU02_05000 [Thaumarchaeota archaeon]|nr:hypothetical protein [Nitrososphaerota archaeon]
MDRDDRLRQLCSDDEEMHNAFKSLGLFLEPARIKQKTEDFVAQCDAEEKVSSNSESTRHLYRILMRLALARGSPDILKKYAEKEDKFFEGKPYRPFIARTEKAIEIARKFYER